MAKALSALGIGSLITMAGFCGAFLTNGNAVGHVLYWQGYLLQNFIPAPNIGTTEKPFYEATPVHFIVFFFGIPVGIILYSLLAYAVLKLSERDKIHNKDCKRGFND